MTSLATLFHHDPATGMDLVPLPSNLVPMGTHGLDTCAALKSTSLTKMGELTQFLKQCDDPAYTVMYQNVSNRPLGPLHALLLRHTKLAARPSPAIALPSYCSCC